MEDKLKAIVDYGNTEKTILKVLEEMAELSEVLLKTITKPEGSKPPIEKIIEESGDVLFRMTILTEKLGIIDKVEKRAIEKGEQVYEWITKNPK